MKLLWTLPLCVAVAGCDRGPADPHGLETGETLLTVAGTGRTEAAPDQALFTAGLSSVAADAKSASARNAEAMNRITAALARLNVPARDIQTRSLSVNRVDYGPNKGRYEASNTLTVRMRDTARVGEAIAAVTDAGANIVSGPNLSVADPEKANLIGYDAAYKAQSARSCDFGHLGEHVGNGLVVVDDRPCEERRSAPIRERRYEPWRFEWGSDRLLEPEFFGHRVRDRQSGDGTTGIGGSA